METRGSVEEGQPAQILLMAVRPVQGAQALCNNSVSSAIRTYRPFSA